MHTIAVVQIPSVLHDRDANMRLAVNCTAEAAGAGASLIVFPEAFIPGYPAWIWRTSAGRDGALMDRLHTVLLDNAVDLADDHLTPLFEAAKRYNVTIVCGLNELEGKAGGGTLYNTVIVIGPSGALLNRHRKMMPTNPERMVHGLGDGAGLNVVETPVGRLGTLICWENYMPLARYALYGQGVQVYVTPTYDQGERWLHTMRHIAREGRCWVIGSGTVLRTCDVPQDLPGREQVFGMAEEWINHGDSVVVDPRGRIVAGPYHQQVGILYAQIDIRAVAIARRTFDPAGHYARPDIFDLKVNRIPAVPIQYLDTSDDR